MAYNYMTKYGKQIHDIIRQGSLTGELETQNINWTGARRFVRKTLKTSGFKDHNRNKGWNSGNIEDGEITYTLAFDRDVEFFVDKMDVDETDEALSAANVTAQFLREHAIPEIDAYRFSKIAAKAVALGQSTEEAVTVDNMHTRLKQAFLPIRKYGASNMLTYMSSHAMDCLERSKEFSKSVSTEKVAHIETRVASVSGVKLVEVWDSDRFKSAFDFTEGFKPAAGAKGINFMTVAKPSIIAKVKVNSIYFFPPGSHTEGDGYLYQNRIYHDLFVDELSQDGIYVSMEA